MNQIQKESKGPIVAATAIIWALGTVMLAITIPLVRITQSGTILPLAVILVIGGCTVFIWSTANQQIKQIAILLDELQALKEKGNFTSSEKSIQLQLTNPEKNLASYRE